MQYRADIYKDGKVALVTDAPGQTIKMHVYNNPIVETQELTQEELEKLKKDQDGKRIVYNRKTSKFVFMPLANVS
jgi:hypothetical protein